jgi:hypothetical protein
MDAYIDYGKKIKRYLRIPLRELVRVEAVYVRLIRPFGKRADGPVTGGSPRKG